MAKTKDWNRFIDDLIEQGDARVIGDEVVQAGANHLLRIDHLYAFISVDKDGNEGLCAAPLPGFDFPMPMIAADPARLKSLVPMAEHLARVSGLTIKLIKLGSREELRTIGKGH